MMPLLYLYKESEKGFELYFNGISTVFGLKAIEKTDNIRLTSIGSTLYKNYGFTTLKAFPEFIKVDKLINFLNQAGDIGLINFGIEIIGKGKMSSHHDNECSFILNNKTDVFKVLKNIVPELQSHLIIASLLSNNGLYISIDNRGEIEKYNTIDEFPNNTT